LMRIAVASGKGGTGKTLIATHLCQMLAQHRHPVTYVDADVEAPNGHLFLKPIVTSRIDATVPVPALAEAPCAGHGRCQEICAFNAILAAKGNVIVLNELCHSCGACVLACPEKALIEADRAIGVIETGQANGIRFIAGRLNVGEARATPLISEVLKRAGDRDEIQQVIIDAPPGVSCTAVEAVKTADLAILVTEPTPFGHHDLGLAVEMCKALEIAPLAVINRSDLGDDAVSRLLRREQVPVIAEIPFDRSIAAAYADGQSVLERSAPFREQLEAVSSYIETGFLGAS
jgi:MinD superfamily P-loop ATPase